MHRANRAISMGLCSLFVQIFSLFIELTANVVLSFSHDEVMMILLFWCKFLKLFMKVDLVFMTISKDNKYTYEYIHSKDNEYDF